jgi:hypothetical protein
LSGLILCRCLLQYFECFGEGLECETATFMRFAYAAQESDPTPAALKLTLTAPCRLFERD